MSRFELNLTEYKVGRAWLRGSYCVDSFRYSSLLYRLAFIHSFWSSRFRVRENLEKSKVFDQYLTEYIGDFIAPAGKFEQYFEELI